LLTTFGYPSLESYCGAAIGWIDSHKRSSFCNDPRLGNEAHLCAFRKTANGFTTQGYAVIFRRGRFRSTIISAGLKGGTSATEAVSLAKVQVARMHG
jgi:hypothetical protein